MIRQLTVASAIAGLLFLPATAAAAVPIDVSSNFPSFNNPDDEDRGFEAVEGDVFDYEDVLTIDGITVNARITVLSVDGFIDVLDAAYDRTSSPWPQVFSQLMFQQEEVGGGKVRYLFEFTDSATDLPVVLTGLRLATRDVDETQYIQASNVKSYSLSSSPATALSVVRPSDDPTVNAGEIRFVSPSIGIDPEDEDYWVSVSFEDVSSFTVELGQGDYDLDEGAYYYLDFDTPDWGTPPTETPAAGPEPVDPSLANTGLTTWSAVLGTMAAGALFIIAFGAFSARSQLRFEGSRTKLLSVLRRAGLRD